MNLREYQQKFVSDISGAFTSFRVVLGVLATGAGKTVCFTHLMHGHKGASAAVVHRREIVEQISMALAAAGVVHRIIAPDPTIARVRRKQLKKFNRQFIDPSADAGVISVQTLTSAASGKDRALQAWVARVTFAVFDEGHHYVREGFWAKAVRMFDRAQVLFVTATPERADGKGLGAHADGFAETMVEGPSTGWLIDNGWLCPFIYKAPETDLNVDNLPVTASGEVNAKAFRGRVVESSLVGNTVEHYLRWLPGKRVLVFCSDVATSREVALEAVARGINAASLDGTTDATVRDDMLTEYGSGKRPLVSNVDLFDEGFDVPATDGVIMDRLTGSLAKFLQMIGRALRPVYAKGYDLTTVAGRKAAIAASDKPHATIIDAVRNWERGHGMPDWPRRWTLDGREKEARGSNADTIPMRVCRECTQPYEKFYGGCPHCGAPVPEPTDRSTPERVDGVLVDLDVEAMRALFSAMDRADMDAADFSADMAARHVPSIGRPRQLRKHLEARAVRQTLRELVGWWVGMQPPTRPMAEKQSRFYYRFGTDIGTAFTLNTTDTQALIERVTKLFGEDMI